MHHNFKEIKRKHGALTLHFSKYKDYCTIRVIHSTRERFRKTHYKKAINQGYLLNGVIRLTLSEYMWLLQWKDIVLLWNNPFPITFNPNVMIPNVPPALNKKKLTLNEKKVIESKSV